MISQPAERHAFTMPGGRTPRVCFVAPFGLGKKTTIWARTLPLARHLVRKGWSTRIIIPPWDTPSDSGQQWVDEGVEIVNVVAAKDLAGTIIRLLREIWAFDPDIVHIVKPRAYAGLVQWWLWQCRRMTRSRISVVLDIDDWEQAWSAINRYPQPVAQFLAWQEEWGIRHADGITAASQWLRERAARYAPATPIRYLPNGVDPPGPDETLWSPTDTHNVLFFSRFVEVTPTWLAAFWRSLCEIKPDAHLVVVGEPVQPGLDLPFRQALAKVEAPGDARISWIGFVPAPAMPGIYAGTACAIFPADEVPLQQAKCSVRLATTLLQGVPVVASAVGEQVAYGAAGAARLVPADTSASAFAAAVAEILEKPHLQMHLARQARNHLLQKYRWDLLAGDLAEFYTKILQANT